jgi:hypothetical protein
MGVALTDLWENERQVSSPAVRFCTFRRSAAVSRSIHSLFPEERTAELVLESNDLQPCYESMIETAKRRGATTSRVLLRIVTA